METWPGVAPGRGRLQFPIAAGRQRLGGALAALPHPLTEPPAGIAPARIAYRAMLALGQRGGAAVGSRTRKASLPKRTPTVGQRRQWTARESNPDLRFAGPGYSRIVLAAHSRVRGESNSLPEIWSFRCALRSDPWRPRSDSNRPHSGDNRAATPSHPRAFRLLAASRTRTARLGNERLESARTRRWGDAPVLRPSKTRSQRAGLTCSLASQSG